MAEDNNKIECIEPIELTCQPVPPISFDASLSPYEAMYKLLYKVNELVEAVNTHSDQIEEILKDIDLITKQLAGTEPSGLLTEITNNTEKINNAFEEIDNLRNNLGTIPVIELSSSNPSKIGPTQLLSIVIPAPTVSNLDGYIFATTVSETFSGNDNIYVAWGEGGVYENVYQAFTVNDQTITATMLGSVQNAVSLFILVPNDSGYTVRTIGGLDSLWTAVNQSLADLLQRINSQATTIATHTNQLAGTADSGLKQLISTNTSNISTLSGTVTTHTNQLAGSISSGLKTSIDRNSGKINTLENKYVTLFSKLNVDRVINVTQQDLTVVDGVSYLSITPPINGTVTDGYTFVMRAAEQIYPNPLGVRVDTGGVYTNSSIVMWGPDHVSSNGADVRVDYTLAITWSGSKGGWFVSAANYSQSAVNSIDAINANINKLIKIENKLGYVQLNSSNVSVIDNKLCIHVPEPDTGYDRTDAADYIGYTFIGTGGTLLSDLDLTQNIYAYLETTQSFIPITNRLTQLRGNQLFTEANNTMLFTFGYTTANAVRCFVMPMNFTIA